MLRIVDTPAYRVAFGIMMGFVFNLLFTVAPSDDTTLGLILGAPFVPALILLAALYFCPESPRYYMRRRGPNYNPVKAHALLLQLRNTEVGGLETAQYLYQGTTAEVRFKLTG